MPLSFNGRTPGFDPGNDGSEPSDGASVFSLFFPFLSARVRGGSNGDICSYSLIYSKTPRRLVGDAGASPAESGGKYNKQRRARLAEKVRG